MSVSLQHMVSDQDMKLGTMAETKKSLANTKTSVQKLQVCSTILLLQYQAHVTVYALYTQL